MKPFELCNFRWDKKFGDAREMLAKIKAQGVRVCVWMNPYISQRSYLFREGKEQGFLLKRKDGRIWQGDLWMPGMGIVDFTNPEACRWFRDKLGEILDMGVDCLKTDFAERIPTDVDWYDGSDPEKMHNYYSYLYHKNVFESGHHGFTGLFQPVCFHGGKPAGRIILLPLRFRFLGP